MNCKKFLVVALILAFVFSSVPKVYAEDTSELILKLLIKKGLITQSEVNELKATVAKEQPAVPRTLEGRVAKLEKKQVELPAWVRNVKFSGDLRLRNENIRNSQSQDNNRQRLRFRWGAKTKINDKLKVGFGIATGSSDSPTSTNQTLENEFDSKNIWLDYAYVKYEPYNWLNLVGGKFKSPFFHTDLLWDSDIRFDGFAGTVSHKFNSDGKIPTSVYLSGGYFPIDDANTADGDDISLLVAQVGTESSFADGYAKLKTGVALYDFRNFKGVTAASLAEERGTNTYTGTYAAGSTTATVANDFDVISPSAKLSFKNIFGLIDVPWGLLAEYAKNIDANNDEIAWRTGLWLGKSKVKKKGDWKLLGQYSRLEADAFPDLFPDADFAGAGTDGRGWELIFDYALADNVIFSIDYYNTTRISANDVDQQIVQTDLIFKF